MSIVKINAISVPKGMEAHLEERFASRAGKIEGHDGFEEFMLLRPVAGDDRYFVLTRWKDEESFEAWKSGEAFAKSHEGLKAGGQSGPMHTGTDLLEFDVVSVHIPD